MFSLDKLEAEPLKNTQKDHLVILDRIGILGIGDIIKLLGS